MTQNTPFFPLGGGMDLVTPAIAMKPGRVVASRNYEPVASGYKRLQGYERYDGKLSPGSIENYYVLHFQNMSQAPAVGDVLWGSLTAGGLGRFVVGTAPVVTSGSIVGGDAAGYIGGYLLAINFVMGESIKLGSLAGPIIAQATGDPILNEAVPEAANGAWLAAAREGLRSAIGPAPGSGPVRGVWFHKGEVMGFRDNGSGGGVAYRSSAFSGWTPVSLSLTFAFSSGGTYEPKVGDSVFGGTSIANGGIKALTLTSGTWAAGDAAGTFTIAVNKGVFVSGEEINVQQVAGGIILHPANLTLDDAGTNYALPAAGRYQFINHNFYGAANLERMYGVNGVGPAFEYDNEVGVITPISTGMTVDEPDRLAAHRQSLFLGFRGGSVQFSQVGEPLVYDPVVGAGEIGIGDDITDFMPANGGILTIFGRNSVSNLYGNDSSDYQLETVNGEAGALPFTAQRLGEVIYMDNRGVRKMSSSQAFGNFGFGTLSDLVQPLIEDYRRDGVSPVASVVCRTKGQYWLFFDNQCGIVIFMGRKDPEILPFCLGKQVTCICSVEDDNGEERIFFGADDGYVYELNKGNSFDGQPIDHYLRLPFNHFGSPHQLKRVHKATIEMETVGSPTLSVSVDFDYGAIQGDDAQLLTITAGGAGLDDVGTNELYYSSQVESVGEAHIDGVGKNVSLKFSGSTINEEPHILQGVTFHVSPRGLRR